MDFLIQSFYSSVLFLMEKMKIKSLKDQLVLKKTTIYCTKDRQILILT